jgi:hypothetical protein
MQMGAAGGHLTYIDGSTIWKPMGQMNTHWIYSLFVGQYGVW